jgi:hypothetical protein
MPVVELRAESLVAGAPVIGVPQFGIVKKVGPDDNIFMTILEHFDECVSLVEAVCRGCGLGRIQQAKPVLSASAPLAGHHVKLAME